MFAFRGKHTKLELTDTRDFWADTKVNMEAVVYPEDKQSFSEHINRETFLRKLDEQIKCGKDIEFAIALCDVNGLKIVNDTQGHKTGDMYIRDAAKLICETFEHSPVFRVGGDEFVVVYDYQNHRRENEYLAL